MQTADFYSSATGTLRVNGGRDENAPQGVSLSIDDLSYIKQGSRATDSGNTGTTDYNELVNKPKINSITLTGNVLLSDIGAQPAIDSSHKVSADNIDDTSTTNKFATVAELEQIETNKNNILNIETQNRNKLPYTLDTLKAINTTGTWSDNVYTINNLTFTVNDDMSISVALVSGDTPTASYFYLCQIADLKFSDITYFGYARYNDRNVDYSTTNYFGLYGVSGVANLILNAGVDIPSDYATKYTHAIIRISAAMTGQYQLWKPVIEDKAIYTSGFVDYTPYSPSNRELYELIMSYHTS